MKENPTMEYPKMIDQTTSIYATIFSGIVVFALPQVFLATSSKYSILMVVGSLLFAVSSVWWLKVQAWSNLLKAEIKFKMVYDPEFKKYNEFIMAELKRAKNKKDGKNVFLTNSTDDLLPKIFFVLSTALVIFYDVYVMFA